MEKQNSAISVADDSKPNYKVKLMCSYGGKIQPRPHDHQLTYAGGHTKILTVDRHINFSDILTKLISLSGTTTTATPEDDGVASFRYQLPGEDLDALVSVINDDDLEHMMAEYDRLYNSTATATIPSKPARLRIFLFSPDRTKTASTSPPLNPDFLFGFDKEYEYDNYQTRSAPEPDIIPRGPVVVRHDFFTGSDPRSTSSEVKIQPQIQGIPLTHGGFSHENSQVVYGIPGYQCGGPGPYAVTVVPVVYSYFPVAMNGVGLEERGHVAGDDGGRAEMYSGAGGGGGVVSPHDQIGDGKTNM
ncbi:hypothetical protein Vadar_024656 [Vaccinium darrowii]|uniref:Uncharacterized protein n=1 Tax=Vaccinium darrowii TaxID=229202 RepID=A0ACB7YFX9_9ERIC|nr:hypothetical protein Vadar_024656 [Vaccinium darrowii]